MANLPERHSVRHAVSGSRRAKQLLVKEEEFTRFWCPGDVTSRPHPSVVLGAPPRRIIVDGLWAGLTS
jgi:hypothetical protein